MLHNRPSSDQQLRQLMAIERKLLFRVWWCLTPLETRLTPIILSILTDNSKKTDERWRLRHDVNRQIYVLHKQIYLWCFECFSQRDAEAHLMNFVTTSFELIKCLRVGWKTFPFRSRLNARAVNLSSRWHDRNISRRWSRHRVNLWDFKIPPPSIERHQINFHILPHSPINFLLIARINSKKYVKYHV